MDLTGVPTGLYLWTRSVLFCRQLLCNTFLNYGINRPHPSVPLPRGTHQDIFLLHLTAANGISSSLCLQLVNDAYFMVSTPRFVVVGSNTSSISCLLEVCKRFLRKLVKTSLQIEQFLFIIFTFTG